MDDQVLLLSAIAGVVCLLFGVMAYIADIPLALFEQRKERQATTQQPARVVPMAPGLRRDRRAVGGAVTPQTDRRVTPWGGDAA